MLALTEQIAITRASTITSWRVSEYRRQTPDDGKTGMLPKSRAKSLI